MSLVIAAVFRPLSLEILSQPRTQSSNPVLLHFASDGFGTPNCTTSTAAPSAPAATPSQRGLTGRSCRGQAGVVELTGDVCRGVAVTGTAGVTRGTSGWPASPGVAWAARGTSGAGAGDSSWDEATALRVTRSRTSATRLTGRPPSAGAIVPRGAPGPPAGPSASGPSPLPG